VGAKETLLESLKAQTEGKASQNTTQEKSEDKTEEAKK
jgi:hypothetical protein